MFKFEKLVKYRSQFVKEFPSYQNAFDSAVAEANIFVFDVVAENKTNLFLGKPNPAATISGTIDMPFKTCSFESISEPLMILSPTKEGTITETIECLLVTENNGFLVIIALLGISKKVSLFDSKRIIAPRFRDIYIHLESCVYDTLKILLKQIEGMEYAEGIMTSKKKIKYKEKTSRKIGDVIYISEKNESKRSESVKGIEFSHRFLRRGHWRKLKNTTLGKDREGNRNQVGRTWVNHYEVGDKSLKLVKKIRVIKK